MASKSVFRAVLVVLFFSLSGMAQVLPLGKVSDPECRTLQQKYIDQLQQIAADAAAVHFPFPFYFSQALDIDEVRQKQMPQGSLRFERVNGGVALAITGNYYISYSADVVNKNQRARRTFQDVVLPLLRAETGKSNRSLPFESFAFEISHHVRSKVMKVGTEGPENLMLFIPRAVGERLAQAKDAETQEAALLESEAYVNGEPFTIWLNGDDAPEDVRERYLARHHRDAPPNSLASLAIRNTVPPSAPGDSSGSPAEPGTLVSPHLIPQSDLLAKMRDEKNNLRDVTPVELEKLQTAHDATLHRLVNDLKGPAHLVDYAPPAFIAFHNGAYLQLSMSTDLEQPAGSSQYRMAALAFDTHIAHFLRPVSKYFHDGARFDGVDFSTTVHQSVQPASLSVEFVVPLTALLCYEKYDCTGQEVINRSIVLINGERVALDLQRAESDSAGTPR
jgi:hypothetical protein